jgi:hypothetical protein
LLSEPVVKNEEEHPTELDYSNYHKDILTQHIDVPDEYYANDFSELFSNADYIDLSHSLSPVKDKISLMIRRDSNPSPG